MTSRASEIFAVSATQVGKTFAVVCKQLVRMWEYRGPHPWWWCAPTYDQGMNGYSIMNEIARSCGILNSTRCVMTPYPVLHFINGVRCEFRSWEKPQNLQGRTIAGGAIDEAGMLTPQAQSAISTRRSATLGPLLYIGNPGLRSGPFRKLCSRAEEQQVNGGEGRYAFFKWTWEDKRRWLEGVNPEEAKRYTAFIEEERAVLPDFEFRRLYDAEWTEDESAVFRGVEECSVAAGAFTRGRKGKQYVHGVDVGQQQDYFVMLAVERGTNQVCSMERFKGVPLTDQVRRIKRQLTLFPGIAVIETNGPGRPLYDACIAAGLPVQPFVTTSQSKNEAVMFLAAALQQGDVILHTMPPLQHELSIYRYQRSMGGSYRYEAPQGEHDDCTSALWIAWWSMYHAPHAGIMEWYRAKYEEQREAEEAEHSTKAPPIPKVKHVTAAIANVDQGKQVCCSAEEWPEVRSALQAQAGKWIDQKQDVKAVIALEEVKRLDRQFGFGLVRVEG